jgi:hypothetical protein
MKYLMLSVLLTILVSCIGERKRMDSWIGSSKQDVIMKFGPPERSASDGGSGEVLVYSNQFYNSYLHTGE